MKVRGCGDDLEFFTCPYSLGFGLKLGMLVKETEEVKLHQGFWSVHLIAC